MEACGGQVQIEDAADGGAVVSLIFPAPKVEDQYRGRDYARP